MSSLAEARETMGRIGWLGMVPEPFRAAVLARVHLMHFKAGEPVYAVGDPPGGIYGLVSGGLGIAIAPGERGPYFAHLARPGAWFGEAAAITGQGRRVGLSATRDTDLLQLPLHDILEMARADPTIWRFMALITIGHLDLAIGASDDLMIRDHAARCVAVLLRLGGARRDDPDRPGPVDVDVTQEDLATLANVSRTTARALLGRLEAGGLISRSYRRITILRADRLRHMLRET